MYLKITSVRIFSLTKKNKKMEKETLYYMICKSLIAKVKPSGASYHQEDRTGALEPAPPDCSTAFPPRLWKPWTQLTPPLFETPHKPPTSWNMDHLTQPPPPPQSYHITEKNCQTFLFLKVCYTQVSGPVQTTCSNTLSSICTRHFHTLLCVHNPTKDSVIYVCFFAHALQITLHCSPASCLNVSLFVHVHYLRGICTVVQFLFSFFFKFMYG